jgi:hypothetical protein
MQGIIVLFLLAPSGLWMARYAETGAVAAMGFSALAIVTATCVLLGWRTAVKRRFAEHRRWMWRCFLLLCSAVVIRVAGGLATVTGYEGEWVYPLMAWASWLGPLAVYALSRAIERQFGRSGIARRVRGGQSPFSRAKMGTDPGVGGHSAASSAALSLPAMDISARR